MAGSQSSKERGMGIPIPFYELLLKCHIDDKGKQLFVNTMIEVYEKGYDFRFGMALAVPIILEELMVKCIWWIRQTFIRNTNWKECFPTSKHSDLRIMLLVSNGAFFAVDSIEASFHGIKEHSLTAFALHLNLIGIGRLASLGLKEAAIRTGLVVKDEGYLIHLFANIPEEERTKLDSLATQIGKYVDDLDYKSSLKSALDDYRIAYEERIRIEAECKKISEELIEERNHMETSVESYFVNYLSVFDEANGLIDKGLDSDDSNLVIKGNNMIQKQLGYDSEFTNQDEFDDLMLSDDTFKL